MAKARLAQIHQELNKAEPIKEPANKVERKPVEVSDSKIPRGQRAEFLKVTITMPADLLVAIRSIGLDRKATGAKDCDTSSLIREGMTDWINKQNNQR